MKRIIALLSFVSSLSATDVSAWYPLASGTVWVYEHESRQISPRGPEITRWTTVETVRASLAIPEGTVVTRNVEMSKGRPDGSWIGTRGEFDYLIRQSCIYFLDRQSWDGTVNQLRRDFHEYLLDGRVSPDLCFPLDIGKHWHAANTTEWAWSVLGRGCAQAAFCPESVSASDFHLVAPQASSGGTAHLWFREGVGITGQWYWHNGTYGELRVRLIRFQAAQH